MVRVALLSTEREEGGERWKERENREKRVKERKGRDRDGRGKRECKRSTMLNWRNSSVGRTLDSTQSTLGLIPGIPQGPSSTVMSDP